MTEPFDKGDLVTVTARFYDRIDELVDPDTVVFKVKPPTGDVDEPTVTHEGVGIYSVDVDITEPGDWIVKAVSTGTGQATQEIQFGVRKPRVE